MTDTLSAASGGQTDLRALRRRIVAILRAPNTLMLAAGLFLPNVLSLVTLTTLVDIGLPPRFGVIMLYATLAIVARRVPFAVTAALFAVLLCFDLIRTLSLMFGLAPSELIAALDQARRIHFLASPLYLTLIASLAATTFATLACLKHRAVLVQANAALLLVMAFSFAAVDYASNVSPHYQFGSTFGRDVPVQSAAEVSGFNAAAGTHGNNVVVVIVESLGYLIDPDARGRIAAPIFDPALRRDYTVSEGRTVYYGSTTSGEMRELCNTRTVYTDFVPKFGYSCLPDLLERRGYTSIAVHGFTGGMFERELWYPKVGFGKELFGDDLIKATNRVCGSAFRGACGADRARPRGRPGRHPDRRRPCAAALVEARPRAVRAGSGRLVSPVAAQHGAGRDASGEQRRDRHALKCLDSFRLCAW